MNKKIVPGIFRFVSMFFFKLFEKGMSKTTVLGTFRFVSMLCSNI